MENNIAPEKNTPQALRLQITSGRRMLLLVIILTAVNLTAVMRDADFYFLFSAAVPYYAVLICKGLENGFVSGPWNRSGPLTRTALVIALVILAVYLLFWLLSKKRTGFLLAAAVLFIVDTLALVAISFWLYENPMVSLKDLLFHGLVLWVMLSGCRASAKLNRLRQEPETDADRMPTAPDLE